MPWIDIINYGKNNYYLIDIVITKSVFQTMGFVFKQEYLEDKNQVSFVWRGEGEGGTKRIIDKKNS